MIGEIRDAETADIASRAAITGHLVLSSLHTNDAASTFMRLVDMGLEPYVVASSVVGVVAQRLVKLICPKCRAVYTPTGADISYLHSLGMEDIPTLYYGAGCDAAIIPGTTAGQRCTKSSKRTTPSVTWSSATKDAGYPWLPENKNQKFLMDNALDLLREGKPIFSSCTASRRRKKNREDFFMIDELIGMAREMDCSDIHMACGEPPIVRKTAN